MNKKLKNAVEKVIKGEEKKEVDHLLNLAKEQGYVANECRLPGEVVMALINQGTNPCDGCNHFDCIKKQEKNK